MSVALPANSYHVSGGGYTTEGAGYTLKVNVDVTAHSNNGADTGYNLYFVLNGNTSDCVASFPLSISGTGGYGNHESFYFRLTNLPQGYQNLDGYMWTYAGNIVLDAIQIFFERVAA